MAKNWQRSPFSEYVKANVVGYLQLSLMDLPKQDLDPHFKEAFRFLEGARYERPFPFDRVVSEQNETIEASPCEKDERRVLVHCILGKSRSPSILIGTCLSLSFYLFLIIFISFVYI